MRTKVAVIAKLRSGIRARAVLTAFLVVSGLTLLNPSSSLAVTCSGGIQCPNGVYSIDTSATLSNNTTGTAANVTGTVAIANGGTGQTSATAAFNALDPLTTKGDIIVHNGTDSVRVAVGSNGQFLKANSAQASGVEWAAASSAPNPVLTLSTVTPVTVLSSTPRYLSMSGDVSSTEADVRTPFVSAVTFGNLQCVPSSGTTNAITAVIGTAACTSAADFTSKAQVVMSATANTTGTSSGSTAVTAGQCAVIKLTAGTDAAATNIHCSYERTA